MRKTPDYAIIYKYRKFANIFVWSNGNMCAGRQTSFKTNRIKNCVRAREQSNNNNDVLCFFYLSVSRSIARLICHRVRSRRDKRAALLSHDDAVSYGPRVMCAVYHNTRGAASSTTMTRTAVYNGLNNHVV